MQPPVPSRRWEILVEQLAPERPGAPALRWLTLPEALDGRAGPSCEEIFGDEWGARVLERVLSKRDWWFWWTEASSWSTVAAQLPGARRMRQLPDVPPPPDSSEPWLARRFFGRRGAALAPPGSELQSAIVANGSSPYSEFEPNFVIGLRAGDAWSPRSLWDWCAGARPLALSSSGLQDSLQAITSVCMYWNGDVAIGVPPAAEANVLGAIAEFSRGFGVHVTRIDARS